MKYPLLVIGTFIALLPLTTFAADYSPHSINENTVMTIDTGNPGVYDFEIIAPDGMEVGDSAEYHSGLTFLEIFGQNDPGIWHALLFSEGMAPCNSQTYAECLENPLYLGLDIPILLTPLSETPSGQDDGASGGGGGYLSYRPEVTILSPKGKFLFSHEGIIQYSATDKNDNDIGKQWAGLGSNPVFINYSDSLLEWNNILVPETDKILIEKGLPAIGYYDWHIKDLLVGVPYRIIVDAIDKAGVVVKEAEIAPKPSPAELVAYARE